MHVEDDGVGVFVGASIYTLIPREKLKYSQTTGLYVPGGMSGFALRAVLTELNYLQTFASIIVIIVKKTEQYFAFNDVNREIKQGFIAVRAQEATKRIS